MERTEFEIRATELLITVEYLLKWSDEDHPVVVQDICRYARDTYGLKYNGDPKNIAGDEIKRQRVQDVLTFLYRLTNGKHASSFPFVVSKKPGERGKYYTSKYCFTNDELIKVISAIHNDKYTRDLDTKELSKRLTRFFCNIFNEEIIEDGVKSLTKSVKKHNESLSRKIELLNKAYRENKCIRIIYKRALFFTRRRLPGEEAYCRVYKICEMNNKPHVILLPLNARGIISESIESIEIPNLPIRDLFYEDEDYEGRLDEIFELNNPHLAKRYRTLDNYIDVQVLAISDTGAFKVSFYFKYKDLQEVESSFEDYFSIPMPVQLCLSFQLNEGKLEGHRWKRKLGWAIECDELKEGETPKYGVTNILINARAIAEWLFNNPDIAMMVEVVSPKIVNSYLGDFFFTPFSKYKKYLSESKLELIQRRINELMNQRND